MAMKLMPNGPAFEALATIIDDTLIVKLSGELDLAATEVLRTTVSAPAADGAGGAVVDLDGLTFCDATGIRELIALQSRLSNGHRTVRFRATRPGLRRIMNITGADLVLNLDPVEKPTPTP